MVQKQETGYYEYSAFLRNTNEQREIRDVKLISIDISD